MKKLISLILSFSIIYSITSILGTSVIVSAASCKHSYTYKYEQLNETQHKKIQFCKKCGIIKNTRMIKHSGYSTGAYSIKDANKHYVNYTCRYCTASYRREQTHSFYSQKNYRDLNNTYHEVISTCKNCSQTKTTQQKHTTSTGSCSRCGHSNANGIANSSKSGSGVCDIYLSKPANDWWIYSNCQRCGSTSSSFVRRKLIKKNISAAGGSKVSIYHQQVKCNDCGNKYWNRCYHEYQ